MDIRKLLQKYALISDQIDTQSLLVVLENLDIVLANEVDGDIVELGCYIGTTSLFIQRLLRGNVKQHKHFYVYDSFEGLPNKEKQDESPAGIAFKAGELKATKKQFMLQFQKAGLEVPTIHKAWFNDLTPSNLPDNIAFAFLDGDFYDSILTSLQLTWPKLSSGGILCIDDYKREALPGVEKAILQYFGPTQTVIKRANIGIITKP